MQIRFFCIAIFFIFSIIKSHSLLFSGAGGVTNICWVPGADNGWTQQCATSGTGSCDTGTYTGTCIIKVANTGNDATCKPTLPPLVENNDTFACATISKGVSLLRTGSPDWILLKKGDTWTNDGTDTSLNYFGTSDTGFLCRLGRSATEPILIGAYGTSTTRPLVKISWVGVGERATIVGSPNAANACRIDFLAIIGIYFNNYRYNPADPDYNAGGPRTGFIAVNNVANFTNFLLIEDTRWDFMGLSASNVAALYIRRNVLMNNYPAPGLSMVNNEAVDGNNYVVIEGNLFYHNGWNVAGGSARDVFTHNTYGQFSEVVSQVMIWNDNIAIQGSDAGIRTRQGGLVQRNLMVGNSDNLDYGTGNTTRTGGGNPVPNSPGVNSVIGNVSMGTEAVTGTTPVGAGLSINGVVQPIIVSGNLIAHTGTGITAGLGLSLKADTLAVTATGNVICDYPTVTIGNSGAGNTVSNNTTSVSCSGPAPTRDLALYDSSVLGGAGTIDSFITVASQNRKDAWNTALTTAEIVPWIMAGYTFP